MVFGCGRRDLGREDLESKRGTTTLRFWHRGEFGGGLFLSSGGEESGLSGFGGKV